MLKNVTLILVLLLSLSLKAQLIDSFSDGEISSNPAWTGNTGDWSVQTSSDVAAGATNSFTLRLAYATASAGTSYISTQVASMSSSNGQSWSFFLGRRAQAYTAANSVKIWLYANESTLTSATVDGMMISIGDNVNDDEIVLNKVTNGAPTAVITSSGAITNSLTDVGVLVRVTRTNANLWTLYTSTLPTTNGTGAIATDLPSAANVTTSQGSATDATYPPADNGYMGLYVSFTSGADARATVEFDQLYFDVSSSSPLPVELSAFNAKVLNGKVNLTWQTATEINNNGFEIQRSADNTDWSTVGFVKGSGHSNSGKSYTFTDNNSISGKNYYRLVQKDNDGTQKTYESILVDVTAPKEFSLSQNYPNPFNPSTVIAYSLPVRSAVVLELFNSIGQRVGLPVNGVKEAGNYTVSVDASQLPAGMYFYKLTANGFTQTRKMMLVK